MGKTATFLSVFIVSLGIFSTRVTAQFYPIPDTTLHISLSNQDRIKVEVQSFQISELITVAAFNEYLSAVKKDSTDAFYQQQFSMSKSFSPTMMKEILTDEKMQELPMPGVSWIVAKNYCQWKTTQNTSQHIKYDLPSLIEVMAWENIYQPQSQPLKTWTINSYDESMFISSHYDYQYDALSEDPPALKRKVVYGKSFHSSAFQFLDSPSFAYNYQDSSIRDLGFRVVRKVKTKQQITATNSQKITVDYGLQNNHFHGVYRENYPNGKLKTLGTFIDGQRSGIWTVWLPNGEMKVQRNYLHNLAYESIFPDVENPYAKHYENYPVYELKRDKDGKFPYRFIREREVSFSQRERTVLTTENEPELFQCIDFKALAKNIFKEGIHWYYYGTTGDFQHQVPTDSLLKLESFAYNWDYDRVEIKEDFFVSNETLQSDVRQLALSFYKNKTDTLPKASVYFPEIRNVLISIKCKGLNPLLPIQSADDLFFFHQYRGEIIKKDRGTNTNQSAIMDKFVFEHDLWEQYGR